MLALLDELTLHDRGHGEDGLGAGRELGEGDGVCGAELFVPLQVAEDMPVFDGDPVDAGHVGGGEDAFAFEEFVVALPSGRVRDDCASFVLLRALIFIEVDEGEHLAANGFVSDPEDEVGSPLHGLGDVREGEQEGAGALGVHGCSIRRAGVERILTERCPDEQRMRDAARCGTWLDLRGCGGGCGGGGGCLPCVALSCWGCNGGFCDVMERVRSSFAQCPLMR